MSQWDWALDVPVGCLHGCRFYPRWLKRWRDRVSGLEVVTGGAIRKVVRFYSAVWRRLTRDETLALTVAGMAMVGIVDSAAQATDWPQFVGPERNGVYRGSALSSSWPAEGPPLVCKRQFAPE